MSYTQTQLDSLKQAIALGALQVRYDNGHTVIYRSIDEMRKVERMMMEALGQTTTIQRRRWQEYSKGL